MSHSYTNYLRVVCGTRHKVAASISVTQSFVDGSVDRIVIAASATDPMIVNPIVNVTIERRDITRKLDEFAAVAIANDIATLKESKECSPYCLATVAQGIAAFLDEYPGHMNDPVTRRIIATILRDGANLESDLAAAKQI